MKAHALLAVLVACALLAQPVLTEKIIILHTDPVSVAEQAKQMEEAGTAPARFQQVYNALHTEDAPAGGDAAPASSGEEVAAPKSEQLTDAEAEKEAREALKSSKAFHPSCDIAVESALCLSDGKKILAPDGVPKGLVLHHTMDNDVLYDYSRYQNHGIGALPCGPGVRGGRGCSARFDGDAYSLTQSSPSLALIRYRSTTCLWVNRVAAGEADVHDNCPLIFVGDASTSPLEVGLNSLSGAVYAKFNNGTVGVQSNARLGLSGWHHVCAVRGKDHVTLFVNGVRDGQAPISATAPDFTSYDVYLGHGPYSPPPCALQVLVDEVKVFSRAIPDYEIQADAFPALQGDSNLARFSCRDCAYDVAVNGCPAGYHLCNKQELNGGAFSVALKMGWATGLTRIFENPKGLEGQPDEPSNIEGKAVGICCTD